MTECRMVGYPNQITYWLFFDVHLSDIVWGKQTIHRTIIIFITIFSHFQRKRFHFLIAIAMTLSQLKSFKLNLSTLGWIFFLELNELFCN